MSGCTYTRPCLQDWERQLYCLIYRNEQKVKPKETTKEFVLKKEQENPRKKKNLIKWRKVIIQKELKAMVMKMLTELGRPVEEHSENVNKEKI